MKQLTLEEEQGKTFQGKRYTVKCRYSTLGEQMMVSVSEEYRPGIIRIYKEDVEILEELIEQLTAAKIYLEDS